MCRTAEMMPMIMNGPELKVGGLEMPDDRPQQLHQDDDEEQIVHAVRDLDRKRVAVLDQVGHVAEEDDRGDREQKPGHEVVDDHLQAIDDHEGPVRPFHSPACRIDGRIGHAPGICLRRGAVRD
jgi:hypothetical protein